MSTLSDAWNLYAELVLSLSSKRSIITETGRWEKHITSYYGKDCLINQITNKSLLQFRAALTKKKLSPQTISHCLSLLRRVLHRAQQWDLFQSKLPNFDMPRFDNKRVRYLSKNEAQELLVELSIKSQLWHDISLLSLHTGLRAGEIFSLRSSHFDAKQKVLYVFDTKSCNRNIPLNEAAQAVLLKNCKAKDFIFKERGQQIKYVNRIFRDAVNACKLNSYTHDRRQKVVFHTLRHTFASWLVQKGTPLVVVGQLLGHKTLHMTARYAHLAPSQGANAVKELEHFAEYVNVNSQEKSFDEE